MKQRKHQRPLLLGKIRMLKKKRVLKRVLKKRVLKKRAPRMPQRMQRRMQQRQLRNQAKISSQMNPIQNLCQSQNKVFSLFNLFFASKLIQQE